MCVGTQL